MVWQKVSLNDKGNETLHWALNWGLTWMKTTTEVSPGVTAEWGQEPSPVTTEGSGDNSIFVKLENGTFHHEPRIDSRFGKGHLSVGSDIYKVDDKLYFAVCLEGKIAFLMKGHPNGVWDITTKPTYYIAAVDEAVGDVISAVFSGNA